MENKKKSPSAEFTGAPGGLKVWTAGVFLATLALYIASAAPYFLFDDNSEFIASAHLLGITHAPGYPIISILGKLFTYLAPAAPGLAVNMVSVFAGAAAVTLAFRLIYILSGWWAPALLGALTLAVSRTFWGVAGEVEVYPLNLFFFFLVLNIAAGLKPGRAGVSRITAIAAVSIFGLINHYTFVLVIPVIVLYIIAINRNDRELLFRILAPVTFIFLVGTSVWIYLPVRSAEEPAIHWKDQTTPSGLFKQLKGVDRKQFAPRAPIVEKFKFGADYFSLASRQWFPAMLVFVPFGIVAAFRRRGPSALLLALWLSLFLGFILLLNYLYGPRSAFVVSVFHITSLALLAVFAGLGTDSVFRWIAGKKLPVMPAIFAVALIIIVSAVINFRYSFNTKDILAYNYGKNLLMNTGRDGIIFSLLETEAFPIASFRATYGQRRDVTLIGNQGDRIEQVARAQYDADTIKLAPELSEDETIYLKSLRGRAPIYFTARMKYDNVPDIKLRTCGLMYQADPSLTKLAKINPWKRIYMDDIDLSYTGYDYITKNVIGKYYVAKAERLLEEGNGEAAQELFESILKFNPASRFLYANIAAIYVALNQLDLARDKYEAALKTLPENVEMGIDTISIYNNLSFVYGRLGEDKKALEMMEKAAALAPKVQVIVANLGKTYWQMNRCKDAIEPLERSLTLGSEIASVHNVLGICYEQANQYPEAEKHYKRALQLAPNLPEIYRDYGIFNTYIANNPRLAVELLSKYVELDPRAEDRGEILINIALQHQQMGEDDDAVNYFLEAIKAKAITTKKRRAIILGALAHSQEKTGRLDLALQTYKSGMCGASEYPDFYKDYGDFLYRNKIDPKTNHYVYTTYLLKTPNAPDKADIRNMIAELEKQLGGKTAFRTNPLPEETQETDLAKLGR